MKQHLTCSSVEPKGQFMTHVVGQVLFSIKICSVKQKLETMHFITVL